jgi:hypothetical protein
MPGWRMAVIEVTLSGTSPGYGFPADRAAVIAVTTLTTTPTRAVRIQLFAFDRTTHDLLDAALQAASPQSGSPWWPGR